DFLDEDPASPRRTRPGVYASRMIGPATAQVQIILLDLRYFREGPGDNAQLLGEAQWRWLEERVDGTQPVLRLIASSNQVLTSSTFRDSWRRYPRDQQRLLALLDRSTTPTLLLSGDRHVIEFSCRTLASGKVLHDITSSGLTHVTDQGNDNVHRL